MFIVIKFETKGTTPIGWGRIEMCSIGLFYKYITSLRLFQNQFEFFALSFVTIISISHVNKIVTEKIPANQKT